MIQNLPNETVYLIMKYLDIPDVGRLMRACKSFYELASQDYLWLVLQKYRFGSSSPPQHDDSEESVLTTFKRMSSLKRASIDIGTAWGDTAQYFEKVPLEPGSARFIRHLIEVWWLQMDGEFLAVPRGYYRPVWRLKLDTNYPAAYAGLTFKVHVADDIANQTHPSSVSECTADASIETFNRRGWFECVGPVIDVGASWAPRMLCGSPRESSWDDGSPAFLKVSFMMYEHQTFKRGLWIDCFELRKVANPGNEDRPDQLIMRIPPTNRPPGNQQSPATDSIVSRFRNLLGSFIGI
ncbi:hypothetical protein BJ742DRAFT_33253 [Cladochytrium replicatum]|nr:hypothetical protein BJ742DRAFT_33253 [Cladochytrium replicatum]